jgi:hypothetical protein
MARNQMMPMNQGNPMMPAQYPQPKRKFGQGIKEFFVGAPGQNTQVSTQTGQQQQVSGQALQNLLQMLQGGQGAPSQFDFSKIKRGAEENFYGSTVPSLAERFTGLGGQNSSAFTGALASAGHGLDRDLAGLEAHYGMQQQQNDRNYLLQLLQQALQPQFENQYRPATGGLFGSAAEGVGQGIGNFGGTVGGLSALKYMGLLL